MGSEIEIQKRATLYVLKVGSQVRADNVWWGLKLVGLGSQYRRNRYGSCSDRGAWGVGSDASSISFR